jgi:hypothetical protein
MASPSLVINPLGENVTERRSRDDRQTEAQETVQDLAEAAVLRALMAKVEPSISTVLLRRVLSKRQSLLLADIEGLAPMVKSSRSAIEAIDALRAGTEDEAAPTEYAYERARAIVEAAYGRMRPHSIPTILPRPVITTDDVGGIRLSWRSEAKQVRANFGAGPELQSYVYFESNSEHNAEDLDSEHLAGRLAWLTGK